MDSPIYSIIFSRNTERILNYTEEEKVAFLQKMREVNQKYSDETILIASSRFSNSRYQQIFVIRLKGGLQEMVEGAAALDDIQFYQNFEIERYLGTLEDGTAVDFSPCPRYVGGQPALFRITLFHAAPGYYQIPKDQVEQIAAQRQACFNEVGAKLVFRANSDWSNEEWQGFSVEWFPGLSALQHFQQNLRATDWARLFQAKTVLGYGMGGTLSPNPWEKR